MTTLDNILDSTLDYTINQSFEEELNRYNARKISTVEAKNVDDLFNILGGQQIECNICYTEDKCLQCYQCEFKYCSDCLNKVISEFKKCSACQCDYKNCYEMIIDKNLKNNLSQNKLLSQRQTNTHINQKNIDNIEYHLEYDIDYDIDYELSVALENSIISNNNKNSTNNQVGKNLLDDIMNYDIPDNKLYNTLKKKHELSSNIENYVEELINNEIMPFQMSSLRNENKTPNFKANYDRVKKILVYYAHDYNLPPIELGYKYFDTIFQTELRILLIKLLDYPNKFNNSWSRISTLFKNAKLTKNDSDKNKKQLLDCVRKIIETKN